MNQKHFELFFAPAIRQDSGAPFGHLVAPRSGSLAEKGNNTTDPDEHACPNPCREAEFAYPHELSRFPCSTPVSSLIPLMPAAGLLALRTAICFMKEGLA